MTRFEITGAMEACSKRYRQGLYDKDHPVDAVRRAVALTWPGLPPGAMPQGRAERAFVRALMRSARAIVRDLEALERMEDVGPREPYLSLSECRPEVLQ